jgi:hypothetical protein
MENSPLNEATLSAKQRKKLKDKDFGIPSKRMFPLHDAEHVRKAIQMFKKCPEEHKKELAENILKSAKKFNVEISDTSEVAKYSEDASFILDDLNKIKNFNEHLRSVSLITESKTILKEINKGKPTMTERDPQVKGYLINETAVTTNSPIVKSNVNGIVTIQATLQEGDVPNRNKRIYATTTLKEAVKSPYIEERLRTKTWYGEAGHPLVPTMERQLYTDQTRISHIVTKVWFEGNSLKSIVESANTVVGRDFAGLILQGSAVAFSMRGIGPITERKGEFLEVKSPLSIYDYDWVIHPSHTIAYMEKIIQESTLNMLTGKDQLSDELLIASGAVLTESAAIKMFNEGMLIPIFEDYVEYLKTSSRNLMLISEQFEFSEDASIKLCADKAFVEVNDNGRKVRVLTEDYLVKELNANLAGMFKEDEAGTTMIPTNPFSTKPNKYLANTLFLKDTDSKEQGQAYADRAETRVIDSDCSLEESGDGSTRTRHRDTFNRLNNQINGRAQMINGAQASPEEVAEIKEKSNRNIENDSIENDMAEFGGVMPFTTERTYTGHMKTLMLHADEIHEPQTTKQDLEDLKNNDEATSTISSDTSNYKSGGVGGVW